MPFIRKWRGFFATMRAYVPLGFEVGMCIISFRAACILLSNQGHLEINDQAYVAMMHMMPQEWRWGVLAGCASGLKAIGFLGFFARTERGVERAFLLRAAGWVLSAVFWTALGVMLLIGAPWTIGNGAILMLGIFSLGLALAGPVTSEDPNGR